MHVIRHKWVQEREQANLLGCQATHVIVDTYTRVPCNPVLGVSVELGLAPETGL